MNYRHTDLLRLVVAHGSFAEAATRAEVSPSAVSQAMKALGQEWNVVLFQRRGRRLVPTALARRVAASLEEGQRNLHRALRPRGGGAMPSQGALRVGAATAPALLYGPVIERAWRQHAPGGVLQLSSLSAQELLDAIRAQALDIGITPIPRRSHLDGIAMVPLHRNQPRIVARAGHPLARSTSLADLASASWAIAHRVGDLALIEEAYRVRAMPLPRVVAECPDVGALVHLVSQSDLLCVLPHPVLLPLASPHALSCIEVQEGMPYYEAFLLWSTNAGEDARRFLVREVVSALQRHVAEHRLG